MNLRYAYLSFLISFHFVCQNYHIRLSLIVESLTILQVPLQLRELNISAPLSSIPKTIGQLKLLEKIVIFHALLKSLPDEFCNLRSLKFLELRDCSRMMLLPESFGKLTNLEHIALTNASSLQMLPHTFGHLSQLKHLCLWGCTNLTFSKGTLGNITTLEYLELSSCKKVKEFPSQVAHQ